MWALRVLLPLLPLGALLAAAGGAAQVVEANVNAGGGSTIYVGGGSDADKYIGQWTIGDLTCYVAKDKVNGIPQVVKHCRNGLLGTYHEMTKEEEAILEAEINRMEEQKRIMQAHIAESNAVMQNTMRSMNNQIQRSMQGMNNYMNQIMQQQFQNAFGLFA